MRAAFHCKRSSTVTHCRLLKKQREVKSGIVRRQLSDDSRAKSDDHEEGPCPRLYFRGYGRGKTEQKTSYLRYMIWPPSESASLSDDLPPWPVPAVLLVAVGPRSAM